jgi:hypothetical protein
LEKIEETLRQSQIQIIEDRRALVLQEKKFWDERDKKLENNNFKIEIGYPTNLTVHYLILGAACLLALRLLIDFS